MSLPILHLHFTSVLTVDRRQERLLFNIWRKKNALFYRRSLSIKIEQRKITLERDDLIEKVFSGKKRKKKRWNRNMFFKDVIFQILPKLSLKIVRNGNSKKDSKQFSAIVFCMVEGDRLLVFHLSSCFKGFLNTRDLVF